MNGANINGNGESIYRSYEVNKLPTNGEWLVQTPTTTTDSPGRIFIRRSCGLCNFISQFWPAQADLTQGLV